MRFGEVRRAQVYICINGASGGECPSVFFFSIWKGHQKYEEIKMPALDDEQKEADRLEPSQHVVRLL